MSATLPLSAGSATLPLSAGSAPGPVPDPVLAARSCTAAVRRELHDLPPEVVEELTGGLEADLAELAAESATPLADRLGSPRGYAEELRAAAGLPPRGGAGDERERPRAGDVIRGDVERVLTDLRSRPWWPGAVERAHQLRPAWWVARGLVAAWMLIAVLVGGGGDWGLGAVLFALVVVAGSVEVGRRTWTGYWSQAATLSANVLAALVLPFALASVLASGDTVYVDSGYVNNGPDTSQGVWVDGQQVTNLYPYDAQGRPLTGVQLLDDSGRPVSTTTTGGAADESAATTESLVPVVDVDGSVRWNAYPLEHAEGSAAPTLPPLPAPTLPALLGAASATVETATAGPTTTSAPGASAVPTASATAADPGAASATP